MLKLTQNRGYQMQNLYDQFLSFLNKGDRLGCLNLIIDRLQKNDIDIVTLYDEILTPSLRESSLEKNRLFNVWEEHLRTSIVRTVIENCYPYVVRERDYKYHSRHQGRVIVVCPPEELHEIGARMVADFFVLCGYDSMYIGANTPRTDIIDVIQHVIPQYIAISVSNHYNLVAARRTIQKINELRDINNADFKIIAGGLAFKQNPSVCEDIGIDIILQDFTEIKKLSEEN